MGGVPRTVGHSLPSGDLPFIATATARHRGRACCSAAEAGRGRSSQRKTRIPWQRCGAGLRTQAFPAAGTRGREAEETQRQADLQTASQPKSRPLDGVG